MYNLAYPLVINFDPKENQIPCLNSENFEMIKNTRPRIERANGRMTIIFSKLLNPIKAAKKPMIIIAKMGSTSIQVNFSFLLPLEIKDDIY